MRWLLIATATLSACKKNAPATPEQDPAAAADAVFDRYLETIGGVDTLKETQNLRVEATSTLVAQGITMSMVIYQERPDRSRTEVSVMGIGTVASGHADGMAWEINPMLGPRLKEGREAEDTARRNRIDLFEAYATHFPERALTGTVEFAGVRCSRIDTTTSTGLPESLYFDVETGLWMGSEATVVIDGAELSMTNLVEKYEDVDGVQIPTITRQKTGAFETVTRFVDVQINLEDFPDLTPPPEILELRGM